MIALYAMRIKNLENFMFLSIIPWDIGNSNCYN